MTSGSMVMTVPLSSCIKIVRYLNGFHRGLNSEPYKSTIIDPQNFRTYLPAGF